MRAGVVSRPSHTPAKENVTDRVPTRAVRASLALQPGVGIAHVTFRREQRRRDMRVGKQREIARKTRRPLWPPPVARALLIAAHACLLLAPGHPVRAQQSPTSAVPSLAPPQVTKFVEARRPNDATGARGAVVDVALAIDADGVLTDATVISTGGEAFDAAALEAVRQFTFSPARRDGRPVPARITYRGGCVHASQLYLDRRGRPTSPETLEGHDVLVYETMGGMPGFEWMRDPARGGRIAFRANDPEALVGAATAGLGLCAVPCLIGDQEAALVRVETLGFATCDLFVVTHTETNKTPRVRAVSGFVSELVAKHREAIEGRTKPSARA